MHSSWLSLLPPLIVIITASITKRLNHSLLLGLFLATLIATDGNPLDATTLLGKRLYYQMFSIETACNYLFLIIISTLIVLISSTGGALAFAHAITKRLRSARMVETASLLVSSTLFIDDYLSNLTAGNAMRSLSDRFAIPRVKLAYLVHALSSPLVVISPISSWIAVLTGQIEKADISTVATQSTKIIGEPFMVYLQLIPFIFYSFLLIASVWFVVRMGISFGPMHTHEMIAHADGNLFGGKHEPAGTIQIKEKAHAWALDLIVPVALLISSVFIGFLYAGGFYLFGGNNSLIQALQNNTDTAPVLLAAGTFTLITSCIMALIRSTISIQELPSILTDGIRFIYSSILMIFLVTTLGEVLKIDLKTGVYLASCVQASLPLALLPCMLFLISSLTSFVMGSTWGTIALMAPIGTQILLALTPGSAPFYLQDIPMVLPVLGAIFAGAICGNHISPISDTTIMASASCGTYPMDHVYTQLPYVIPVIISSLISFCMAGFLAPFYTLSITIISSMLAGLVPCLATLWIINKIAKKYRP